MERIIYILKNHPKTQPIIVIIVVGAVIVWFLLGALNEIQGNYPNGLIPIEQQIEPQSSEK